MKLRFWRFVMYFAWTGSDFADDFVEWAQQKYSNELYGIGEID